MNGFEETRTTYLKKKLPFMFKLYLTAKQALFCRHVFINHAENNKV